jgi:hypothetical protein
LEFLGFKTLEFSLEIPSTFSSNFLAPALSQESSKELSAAEKPNIDQQQRTCEAFSSILRVLTAFMRQN